MNDLFLSLSFLKRLFIDQSHIREAKWRSLFKNTQINKDIPLFRARELELTEYFRISKIDLWKIYLSKGFPNTKKYKNYLASFFEGRTRQGKLKTAYEEAAVFYSIRLMLAYERYSMITRYLENLFEHFGKTTHSLDGIMILEYGCGVSDIGLLLSMLGADVTICDLSDWKLSFAEWRYRIRGKKVKVMAIDDPEYIPDLGRNRYNLVVATEVFEHVRNPLKLLEEITKSLCSGGLLFDSMGGKFEREIQGDHLAEAVEMGNSENYRYFYQENYLPIKVSGESTFLFQCKR